MKERVYRVLLAVLFLAVIVVIVVCFLARNGKREEELKELEWWKTSIVYQVYPRSLYDANPDGTGDIAGIKSKAGYLRDLGVGAVWLSPMYTSPMKDFGYDISNFTDIDPIFGNMKDFDELVGELHSNGLKMIMDFVPNHSSDQHEWFQKSVKREDPYTDYYVWGNKTGDNATGSPLPPNNWLSEFRGSAWEWNEERQQFYLHQFLAEQPDLNYRNPSVREEMKDVLTFWLERGVDGFRVDAIRYLVEVEDLSLNEPVDTASGITDPEDYHYLDHIYTSNQPETFQYIREWRELIDQYNNKVTMLEVYDTNITTVMRYYGNDTAPLGDFPFNFFLIDNLKNRTEVTGHTLWSTITLWLDNMPPGKWPNWVLGNHDNGRVASRLGVDLVDGLNMLNLLLPGTAVTYNGEEIGMENTFVSWEESVDPEGCHWGIDHYQEHTRDPERTPMQWDNTTFAGFTTANHTWLPVNDNYKWLNVKAQEQEETSHLKLYRELATLRKQETFTRGEVAFPVITDRIFSLLRYYEGSETYLLVINLSEDYDVFDLHHDASFQLPESGTLVLQSINGTNHGTHSGSEVFLDEVPLNGGEGIVLSVP